MCSLLGRALRASVAAVAVLFASFSARGQERVFTEGFQTNPIGRGWELFGQAELFRWDAAAENLRVTWDSARSNTFLTLPLGMTLTRKDDFSASLDLLLEDIAPGTTAGKAGALQLAFGFQNQTDAQKPGFVRGTSTDSPNLVEFNFFPDTGFGATVWPAALSTNSGMNYNGPQDFSIFELPTGVVMRIALEYSASNETVTVAVRTNGILVGPITSAKLSTNSGQFSQPFTDFAVNAFVLPSYSDLGQTGEFSGSLLAHGVIDNVEVRVPALPVSELRAHAGVNGVMVTFVSRAGFSYVVETTEDFKAWTPVADEVESAAGERISVTDPGAANARHRFYRVAARRSN